MVAALVGKYRELDEQAHPTGANKPNSIIDNEAAQLAAQNQHTNNTQLKHAVAHNNIKKLPKDTESNGLDEISVAAGGNTKYARNKNLLATLLGGGEAGTFCASNPSACAQLHLENFSNGFTEQYDPKYQIYGNQQVNDDNYVPEASNYAGGVGWGGKNGNNKIGCVGCGGSAVENMAQYPQQPPVNEIVNNNNNQGGQLKKGFCAATMGGKKLAF